MRLSLVASSFPPQLGGMQNHAVGLARALSQMHEVVVYTDRRLDGHVYDLPFEVRPVVIRHPRPDFSSVPLNGADAILTLAAGFSPIAQIARVPVFCYCHGNDFIKQFIAPRSPAEDRMLHMLGRIPLLRRKERQLRRWINARNIKRGLSAARAVFVNSAYTSQCLRDTFPNLEPPVYVSPPGLPSRFFTRPSTPAAPPSDRGLRIVTVSRLSSNARLKRIDELLRALSILSAEIDFEYVVIGDGNIRGELEALARSVGIADKTRFLGALSDEEKSDWLDASDLFVLPSCNQDETTVAGEGFGIVFAEALARGVPAVAVRTGGVVDIIEHGVNGALIDEAEPASIAAGIKHFLAMKDRISKESIRKSVEKFQWNRVTAEMNTIFLEHMVPDQERSSVSRVQKGSLQSGF